MPNQLQPFERVQTNQVQFPDRCSELVGQIVQRRRHPLAIPHGGKYAANPLRRFTVSQFKTAHNTNACAAGAMSRQL
ncbi:hypothetical protein [Ottowia sp.]|uniref:hypothetical protein n=1 Tax=Ottowia sp. TaxID=1898956 RepID=UPI0025D92957|nr:hypothetical protein [Ottowia sp.]MBK6616691.1 hypothetical protein [Ottowia sp.]